MADSAQSRRLTAGVPSDLEAVRNAAWEFVRSTPGYLSEREARFLMLAAARSPGGAIVEIGSFKGRSTVALAYMAKRYGFSPVIAVDPHSAPSITDPKLDGLTSSYDEFIANLHRAGVADAVLVHRQYSRDFARSMSQPIRLLWIDGDHTVAGAREDVQLFLPFLKPGAILAMHDVLGGWEGPQRVFCEDILGSDHFGPAGFSGSIGWAQYRPCDGRRFRSRRRLLAYPAKKLIRVAQTGRGLVGFHKYWYKFWRSLAPHGATDPDRWTSRVANGFRDGANTHLHSLGS